MASLGSLVQAQRTTIYGRLARGERRQFTSKTTAYVEIQGLQTLTQHFAASALIIEQLTPQILDVVGDNVIDNARVLVRWRTGDTYRSINKTPGPYFAGGNWVIDIGPTTFYSRFLEFGTIHARPYPFMIPAADYVAPAYISAMIELAEIPNQMKHTAGRGGGDIFSDQRVQAPLAPLRNWLYSTEKALGDIAVFVGGARLSPLRGQMLSLAALLGDVQAATAGTVATRISRRLQGRATGHLIGVGAASVFASRTYTAQIGGALGTRIYSRVLGRAAGKGLGSLGTLKSQLRGSF